MNTKDKLLKQKKEIEEKLRLLENENKEDERVTFFKQWSDKKYCLEAVKQKGYALRYVKDKTTFEKITGLKIRS